MSQDSNFTPLFEYIDSKNDELFERLQGVIATKEDVQQINERLDGIVVVVKKLDEERLFTIEWIRRIEGEVEKIKKHLQVA